MNKTTALSIVILFEKKSFAVLCLTTYQYVHNNWTGYVILVGGFTQLSDTASPHRNNAQPACL